MKINTKVRYGLKALAYIAENSNDKEQYSKRMAGMSAIPKGMYERSTVK